MSDRYCVKPFTEESYTITLGGGASGWVRRWWLVVDKETGKVISRHKTPDNARLKVEKLKRQLERERKRAEATERERV